MKVAVVGGGIAGLAAATVLAERRHAVTVYEREASFGGRLRAWPLTLSDGTSLHMERGFHAFFRQYYNLRALMRRWDPSLSSLVALEDYPILGPDGVRLRFDKLPKKSPWNVAAVARRGAPWLGLRDLLAIDKKKALLMLAWDERLYSQLDGQSATEFLDGLRFPPDARRMLFDVFAHSFFNPEGDMSAAELLMMFHFYFTGNPEGLVFDVLKDAFEPAFTRPWLAWLERRGVALQAGTPVSSIMRNGAGFVVGSAKGEMSFDGVVLATEVPGLRALAAESDIFTLGDRRRIDSLDVTAPFFVHRMWLDKPTVGREPFVGTAGLGRLDNISCFHLFEAESRAWAARTGGSVVELHAYGVEGSGAGTGTGNVDEGGLRAELLRQLYELYPETRKAKILDEVMLFEQDCPAFRPGSRKMRPGVETETPGVALAGDFVALPFPSALMERAATSGILAANAVLRASTESGGIGDEEPIRTITPRGMLAPIVGWLGA